ncbi:MAG TPA: LacI family DNA-binding transcriptional regulator, partial [Spongiibacteraceae bacterium]|nr:LacI family DNA-binding transcriptional regulator [Spongiibacteraceae bacterium]
DVARLAGVSPKTVSRVVNGEAHVREATKAAVEKAISALGYRPNLAARSLAASRSFLIGLISMRLDAYIFRSMHSSGVRACRERGLHLFVEELESIDNHTLSYLESSLRQMRPEGVIVSQLSDQPEILDLLEGLNIRYVRILPNTEPERSDAVTSNGSQGMKLQAEHLWNLGHRHIAIVEPDLPWRHVFKERLIELGCDPAQLVALNFDWRKPPVESGSEIAAALLALPVRPTAIHAFNDEVAAGLINYAWAHGLHIPRDLSVAGFDDAEISRAVWPSITTVRQPFEAMIEAAVELLTDPSDDGKPREVVCPVQLIVRESTAAPNTAN